ncbi:MAG: hypothetical protein PHQ04_12645 [Opitutaceae bacterium]|nr:hypothetical protein [Opitutaceae bacterium]
MKPPLLLLIGVLMLAGCSSVSSQRDPTIRLDQFKRIFVEHRLTDRQGIDQLVVQELRNLGYEASCGPLTMMPEKVDAILSYEDRWAWDFRTYLIELSLQLRAVDAPRTFATARYFRPAITSAATPAEMVHLTVARLFGSSSKIGDMW